MSKEKDKPQGINESESNEGVKTLRMRDKLTGIERKMQGCAAALLYLGESIERYGGAIAGTGWLFEMLADTLTDSADKLEEIEASL